MISYQIIQQPDRTGEFRLGELYSGSIKVTTPFCACLTSKGVVPHLSPDLVLQHVNTQVFYLAAEDCERRVFSASTDAASNAHSKLLKMV